ncbi:hypothetical protein [Streptomyces clavuligerus]|uniref:hypothetical protein n=1 Tax=Streptomyces clavuligerus TaxID=1901 RepID=UPI0012FE9D5D|nr:hypothetical protein [Streptomyces clavuligerus]MBY6301002.1 hypothetical protein [Streptomyces clavuligerus]QPJ96991.1 hypothetical protein GE265_28145 [Streptomyces clavuligerus]WDN55809.1 hypothetical protein LL058_28360 [Streptomyces clavuligerus]
MFTEYAWHLPCPQCDADARQPCQAPRKQSRHDRLNKLLTQNGRDPIPAPEYGFMHAQRTAAGVRHRARDIGAAPWREDRTPGVRYDTIDRSEPWTAPSRSDHPELILAPDDVDRSGRARLGANRYDRSTIAWPYGLEDGVARAVRKDPERLARALVHLAVGRSTLVSWASHYGLTSSRREPCCTRWLTRPAHRVCRLDPMTGDRECWDGYSYGRDWRDHPMAWTTTEGRPAALTSAPYLRPEHVATELDILTSRDERLAWISGADGWYGFHTHQIVIWRRDLLGRIDTADRIRDAVQTALSPAIAPPGTT